MLTIATWNVNSVKSRLVQLLEWLREGKPDIVLLQETKCTCENFPLMEIEELGYNIATYGEKSYNGVAILSKFPLEDIKRGLPGDESDAQCRYIEAVVTIPSSSAFRIASVYVPNGQSADSDKFAYKLRFLERLYAHIQTLLPYEEMLAIGGDYNIAPQDIDGHNPKAWEGSVLTHDKVRQALRKIANLGIYDAFRLSHPSAPDYSWWDYRAASFAADAGLRIDHILLSPQAADRLSDCRILKNMRAAEKASDHTVVISDFK